MIFLSFYASDINFIPYFTHIEFFTFDGSRAQIMPVDFADAYLQITRSWAIGGAY